MENEKLGSFIIKLVVFSVIAGFLTGVLELYVGHRFILNPLLYDKDANFVYESFFAPTYYGLTKSIVVSIVFFFVYLLTFGKRIIPIIKAAAVGILGSAIFGIYYYITFPRVSLFGGVAIGIVHFLFIAGVPYLFTKIIKFNN
jgi:hypothetical protein